MRGATALLWSLCLGLAGQSCFAQLTDDNLTFAYAASPDIALARQGGNVQGRFSRTTGTIAFDPATQALRFKCPGTDMLLFPSAGNLPADEGTLVFDQCYDFAARLAENKLPPVNHQLFVNHTQGERNPFGCALFYETRHDMDPAMLLVTFMSATENRKWHYESISLKRDAFPAGQFFRLGLSWRGGELAFLVNNQLVRKFKLEKTPFVGAELRLGGTGEQALAGKIRSVKIYKAACF